MARRRNAVMKRFTKMKGLPKEERMLLQRVASLIDAALNNRQPGNPYEPSRNKNNRVVYPVTGLTTVTGIKQVKLLWDASDSDQLLRYSIEITNLDTGGTATRSSFTNTYSFYGDPGHYKAVVKSVGRDGSSSPVKTITFQIAGDVMVIEGAKNDPDELGILIQDDIVHMQGCLIFVWGSCVLDAYQGVQANNNIKMSLYRREGENMTFDLTPDLEYPTELIETIELYPATESASSLDDYALGQAISRPVDVRLGSFETSQSTMFTPIAVEEDEVGKTFTYFIKLTNREASGDEVGLSIVLWEGAEGAADAIPGDPNIGPPDYTWPHYNSFHCRNVSYTGSVVTDARWAMGKCWDQYNLVGNQWTVAMWVRFNDLRKPQAGDDSIIEGKTWWLFHRYPLRNDTSSNNTLYNSIRLQLQVIQNDPATVYGAPYDGSDYYHSITLSVYPAKDAYDNWPGTATNSLGTWTGIIKDVDKGTSDLLPWCRKSSTLDEGIDGVNNGWYFIAICFEGNTLNKTGLPKIRLWINNSYTSDWFETAAPGGFHTYGMWNQTALIVGGNSRTMQMSNIALMSNRTYQDDREDLLYSFCANAITSWPHTTERWYGDHGVLSGAIDNMSYASNMQIHQAGIWNVALDDWTGYGYGAGGTGAAALWYLYNGGYGTDVDWKANSAQEPQLDGSVYQGYVQAENLCHFWQFGQVERAFSTGYPLRDLGNHLYNGDINFTGQITPIVTGASVNSAATPNAWSWNTSIADIYSPEGDNGTTQYDYSYPGQNLP